MWPDNSRMLSGLLKTVLAVASVGRLSFMSPYNASVSQQDSYSIPPEDLLMRLSVVIIYMLASLTAIAQPSPKPLLLRHPTVSRSQIAFSFADEIWVADRKGGEARQITLGGGT